jgi:FtsP/CotA-like multicopper oxidase with cupredoxin domain
MAIIRGREGAGRLFLYFCSLALLVLLPAAHAAAETREYDLIVDYTTVNLTGRDVRAMTINGGIPGPTIELTEGDFARIRVHNRMDVDTSVHWHGILLPNKEDGVPYVTTPPIKPATMREFAFPVVQSGTYWYHSHTGLQEQRGVYGSIVIQPKGERVRADREYVVVFSDWTDENPDEVMRTLKRGSDYYSLKKGSVQSLAGAIRADALGETFQGSLMRMPPMDISDVAYDLFLVNGKRDAVFEAKPGEKVLLRVINASASTYFYLQFAGGDMSVVSADGMDVRPVSLPRLLIAVAETYDVVLTMPGDGSHEFRATAQDGSGHTAAFLGQGERVPAPDMPKPDIYRMHGGGPGMSHGSPAGNVAGPDMKGMHSGEMTGMMDNQRPMPPYAQLFSRESTALSAERPTRTITLTLTGDMERYVWSFDGKVISEADSIPVRKGENLRVVFVNKTMMHHPLHLHGHFFRVVDGQRKRGEGLAPPLPSPLPHEGGHDEGVPLRGLHGGCGGGRGEERAGEFPAARPVVRLGRAFAPHADGRGLPRALDKQAHHHAPGRRRMERRRLGPGGLLCLRLQSLHPGLRGNQRDGRLHAGLCRRVAAPAA